MDCQTDVDWIYADTEASEMMNSNSVITCLCPLMACTIYPSQLKSVWEMFILLNLRFSRRQLWRILSSVRWRREMSLIEGQWCFGGILWLHLQVRKCARQRTRSRQQVICEDVKSNTAEFLRKYLHYRPTLNTKFHGNPFSSQYRDNTYCQTDGRRRPNI
jgi:hypothetical protein